MSGSAELTKFAPRVVLPAQLCSKLKAHQACFFIRQCQLTFPAQLLERTTCKQKWRNGERFCRTRPELTHPWYFPPPSPSWPVSNFLSFYLIHHIYLISLVHPIHLLHLIHQKTTTTTITNKQQWQTRQRKQPTKTKNSK